MRTINQILTERNQEQLVKYFNGVKGVVRTTGTGEGLIIKFNEFYLKIYDGIHGSDYTVQGYKYGDSTPMFTDNVKESQMRQYALKFKQK